MSSNISMKPLTKPLKGQILQSNYGSFDTVSTNNLVLENLSIEGLIENGIFSGTIDGGEINNTPIGVTTPSLGYFTDLTTYFDVLFNSNIIGSFVSWDHNTGTLNLGNSTFRVNGCSYLGNLRICNNFIRATNLGGDVEIIPNGGSVYLNGPVYNVSSYGNFYTEMQNGSLTFNVKNNISLQSTSGSSVISTFNGQTFNNINGDISLITESNLTSKYMVLTNTSSGITTITTSTNHNLTSGNVITVSSTGSIDNNYTIGNILSPTSFTITNTNMSVSNLTGGSLIKIPSSKINLNSSTFVTIPENIDLTFGTTTNSVSGNTSGLIISSNKDIAFNISSGNSLLIPTNTQINFASSTSGSFGYVSTGNYINYNGSSINIVGTNSIIQSGLLTQLNTTNTKIYDPIVTIADYTLVSQDNKDRGIEYRYLSSSGSMKLGWFGYKTSTNKFTFIPDATNNNEIISGAVGQFEIGDISANNVTLNTGGNFDVNCGNLLNVNRITGCGGTINLLATNNLNITAGNRIALNASGDIYVPNNIPITIGTSGSSIRESTNGNLRLSTSQNISISAASVIIPINTYLSFDGTSVGSQRISSNTSGDLLINTNKNMYLTTTGGNIIIPTSTNIQLGNSTELIWGTTSGIYILGNSNNIIATSNVNISSSSGNIVLTSNSGDINLYSTGGNVRLLNNRNLVFSMTGTTNSISSNTSGNLVVYGNGNSNSVDFKNINEINLSANSSVNLSTGTILYFDSNRNISIRSDNSNNLNVLNQNALGNTNITTANFNVINGTIGSTLFSTGNFTISGTTGSTVNINMENVKFQDPILTLANYNLSSNDFKDRGIEYSYLLNTTSSLKSSWFGWKNSTQRFTYYSDTINTNEVISGTIGSAEFSSIYLKDNLIFQSSGSINLNCGTISNLNTLIGCGGTINIVATSNTNISSNNIMLLAGTKVQMPYNVPLSFGSTDNSISSDSNGNLTISSLAGSGTVILNGNVQINGTTTTVYSTVTNLQDPIFSIGGVTGPIINDAKDRGIEIKWNDGTGTSGSKTGFFGYKNSLGRFVFIQDGVNLYEVFYGSYGNVQFGDGYFTNLDIQNGRINNVNTITGSSSGILNLSSGNINIPYNSNLNFGTTSNSISVTTSGNLTLKSTNDINITSQTGSIYLNVSTSGSSSVNISNNTPLYFGSQTSSNYVMSSGGNLNITSSSGNINLTPKASTGTVLIPTNTILSFGSTSNSIVSDGTQLLINGYNGVGINTSNFTISGNVNIIGTITSTPDPDSDLNRYILPLGTSQYLDITSIANYSGPLSGNIKIKVNSTHNFSVGDSILIKNSDSTPKIDDNYIISGIVSETEFTITNTSSLTVSGTKGIIKSNLTTFQGKDVGIQVNYWTTVGNTSLTSGSLGYKTGFYGFKSSSQRWVYYKDATINDNIVSGTLSDIEVNKVFANNLSGFVLDGGVSAGSNAIMGNNFQISGGNINNTPIGVTAAQTGRFTNLTNTVAANLQNVTMTSSLVYSIDRYIMSSGFPIRAPLLTTIVSIFSVTSPSFTGAMGTIGSSSISIPDGTVKIVVCGSMAAGSIYSLYFGNGKLIAPNPININTQPTRIIFKRQGQCAKLLFDATGDNNLGSWILLTGGVYVE
jgi:hypothetical protein